MNTAENTWIYISNLPDDVHESELVEFFTKCGVIKKDPETGMGCSSAGPYVVDEFKVKLYRDSEGKPKGDGVLRYLRKESVLLAVEMLDGTLFRPEGPEINVAPVLLSEDDL